MLIKRFILIFTFSSWLVGCATLSDSQETVPVYKNGAKVQSKPGTAAKGKKSKKSKSKVVQPAVEQPKSAAPVGPDIVEVKPLGDNAASGPQIQALAPEPLTPEQQAFIAEQNGVSSPQGQPQVPQGASSAEGQVAPIVVDNVNGPVVVDQKPELATVQVDQPFQPLDAFAPLSPAVNALVLSANQSNQSGSVESAMTTIERAIRIEPRNATLYYKLAVLKLKSLKFREAEDLAKKAALLGVNDVAIKKHSWLLIAKSRELQGNVEGANEARVKANGF